RIDEGNLFSVCYVDLDKFKAFNDKYGFKSGDEVIKNTARILIRAVREKGKAQDFIGHIGGDDFVVVTIPEKTDAICKYVIKQFDDFIPSLYNQEDIKKGYIMGKDRQGVTKKIPLMSISIGVVSNKEHKISHVAEIGEIGAGLKEYAKSLEGSNYVKERRHE
ncbi:MAG: GGDEF domain-containing protein, partial [Candidatus Omnitrophota bacterium]|nr:GGDEF domain-containing protein [Candidatus Omnitrophota bacterium]